MTVDEPRVRVTTNLALGICLILLGTVLILDRLGLVPASQLLRFWPVGLVLFGVTMVIQSFQRGDPASAAQRQDNGLGHVIVWVIIALVFSQGFSRGVTVRTDSSETASVVAVMGRQSADQQRARLPRRRGDDDHGTRRTGPAARRPSPR